MMSGVILETCTPPAPNPLLAERARWLASLRPGERARLVDMSLREVDARFEAWRRRRQTRRPPGA